MTSSSEKKRRKAIVDAIRAKERAEILDTMPLSVETLSGLISHLESSLGEASCDHSLKQTWAFLEGIELDPEAIVPWLNEHGGFCDCEVVYNVAETLEEITYRPPHVVIPSKAKDIRPKLGPVVTTGFGVTLQIAAPWRAGYGKDGEAPFVIQLGRRNSRSLHVFDNEAPASEAAPDDTWIRLWLDADDFLYDKGDWNVQRRLLGPADQLSSVTVSTKEWAPVLIWIVRAGDPRWHMRFETDFAKAASDWRELSALLARAELFDRGS